MASVLGNWVFWADVAAPVFIVGGKDICIGGVRIRLDS